MTCRGSSHGGLFNPRGPVPPQASPPRGPAPGAASGLDEAPLRQRRAWRPQLDSWETGQDLTMDR